MAHIIKRRYILSDYFHNVTFNNATHRIEFLSLEKFPRSLDELNAVAIPIKIVTFASDLQNSSSSSTTTTTTKHVSNPLPPNSSTTTMTYMDQFLNTLIQQHKQIIIISLLFMLLFCLILIFIQRMLYNKIKKKRSSIISWATDHNNSMVKLQTIRHLNTSIEDLEKQELIHKLNDYEQLQEQEQQQQQQQQQGENMNPSKMSTTIIDFDGYASIIPSDINKHVSTI